MRIALISRRFPPLIGGAEKVLSYLASALVTAGAEVFVLTANPPGGVEVEKNAAPAPTIVRLPTASTRFVGTWLYMRNLGRWLRTHEVDVAYVSMLKHDAYVTIGVGKARGFPVVVRPEGAGATGDLAWQSWGRFGRTIAARCRTADAVVSIAPAIAAELSADGHDPGRIHALPNGVPVPSVPWSPRPDWSDAPRAAFVGRLAPEKGLDALIDAWPLVRAVFPRAELELIGDGPERPALAAQIDRLGLQGAIHLPGSVADPTPRLRAVDLFALPSREEGMSIALLEALALGLPVVASSVPGNRQLVTDFQHGRLAPPDSPGALAQAILDQWSNPAQARQFAQAARRRVQAEFSIEAMARRHLGLFQSLIDRPVTPRT